MIYVHWTLDSEPSRDRNVPASRKPILLKAHKLNYVNKFSYFRSPTTGSFCLLEDLPVIKTLIMKKIYPVLN